MPLPGGPEHIDLPPSIFEIPPTPLTESDISVLEVIPPTPPLEAVESCTDTSVRIQEDYGFADVAEVINIGESAITTFLKPSSPFQDGEGSAYNEIEHTENKNIAPTCRRKALLIGIKYDGVTAPVEGAHNDVEDMKVFLVDHYGWLEEDISTLKDDGKPTLQPTRDNILSEIKRLVKGACAGDRLFLYFSGHGGQITDMDGDEEDGLDEVIFSCDKQQIVDDELHDLLVKPLPAGCRLTALFDCCCSGTSLDLPVMQTSSPAEQLSALLIPMTSMDLQSDQSVSPLSGDVNMLDLPHLYNYPSVTPESAFAPELSSSIDPVSARPEPRRKWTAGDVIMWSSCDDSERSYEVMASKDRKMKGAMTLAFIECLKDRKKQTYRELLDALNEMLVLWGCPQKPVMSSAHFVNMTDMVSI